MSAPMSSSAPVAQREEYRAPSAQNKASSPKNQAAIEHAAYNFLNEEYPTLTAVADLKKRKVELMASKANGEAPRDALLTKAIDHAAKRIALFAERDAALARAAEKQVSIDIQEQTLAAKKEEIARVRALLAAKEKEAARARAFLAVKEEEAARVKATLAVRQAAKAAKQAAREEQRAIHRPALSSPPKV